MPHRKFNQIYAELKERIESGVYTVGQMLPSENTLIKEFDCSRNTVRRAVGCLVRDGYVQTSQGRGICNIYQPLEPSSYAIDTIESFAEASRRTGQHGTSRVVQFETCTADEALARKTGFPVGTALFHQICIHNIDGIPRILNHNYFRQDCMPNLNAEIASGSIYHYLEDELGMSIVTSKRIFTVEHATEEDRALLQLDGYDCLAVVRSQTYNSEGVMFECTQSRHYPGIFRFQSNAVRQHVTATPRKAPATTTSR